MTPTFQGEMQLSGWSDTHTGGAKVTFWLPDAESLEVFKGMTAKKGNIAGHRFAAVLVEIGDDEQPVSNDSLKCEKHKGGELAKWAGILCNDPEFIAWVEEAEGDELGKDGVVYLLKKTCGIKSRAELDHNKQAAKIFR